MPAPSGEGRTGSGSDHPAPRAMHRRKGTGLERGSSVVPRHDSHLRGQTHRADPDSDFPLASCSFQQTDFYNSHDQTPTLLYPKPP